MAQQKAQESLAVGTAWEVWEGKPAVVLPTRHGFLVTLSLTLEGAKLHAPLATSCHGRAARPPSIPPQGCSLSPPHDHEGIGEGVLEVPMKGPAAKAWPLLLPFARQRSLVAQPEARKRTGTRRTWPAQHTPTRHASVSSQNNCKNRWCTRNKTITGA